MNKGEDMRFRKEWVDNVRVIEANSKEELVKAIKAIGRNNIIVDIQYGVAYWSYSALILIRKK